MSVTTQTPVTEPIETYCDCPRQRDMWRCQTEGNSPCQPGTEKGCALFATLRATGYPDWDSEARYELRKRPCTTCGTRKQNG